MKPILILLQAMLALSLLGQGLPPTTATNGPASHEFVKQHYNYLKDLTDKNEEHRKLLWESIKEMTSFCMKVGATVAAFIGAVALFFGWKKDKTLKEHLAEHDKDLEDSLRRKLDRHEKDIEAHLASQVAKIKTEANEKFSEMMLELVQEWKPEFESKVATLITDSEARMRQGNEEEQRIRDEERRILKLVRDAEDAMRTPVTDPAYASTMRFSEQRVLRYLFNTKPADLRIYHVAGMILSRRNKFEEAIRWLREATELPDMRPGMDENKKMDATQRMADVRFNLACYLNRQADQIRDSKADEARKLAEEAMERLNEACTMHPDNVEFAKDDPQLKTLIDGKVWVPKTSCWVPLRNDV